MPINDILTGAKELWKRHLPTFEYGPSGTIIINDPSLGDMANANGAVYPMLRAFDKPRPLLEKYMSKIMKAMPPIIVRDSKTGRGEGTLNHELLHIGQRQFSPTAQIAIDAASNNDAYPSIGVPNNEMYNDASPVERLRKLSVEAPAFAASALSNPAADAVAKRVAYDQLIRYAKAADSIDNASGEKGQLWPYLPPGPGVQALRQITKKPLVHPK